MTTASHVQTVWRPTRRLLVLLGGSIFLGLIGMRVPLVLWAWLVMMTLLVAGAVLDLMTLLPLRFTFDELQTDHPPVVQQGFLLTIIFRGVLPASVLMQVRAVGSDVFSPSKWGAHVTPGSDPHQWLATWEMFAEARGAFCWPGADIRLTTPLKLLERFIRLSGQELKVFPALHYDSRSSLNPALLREQLGVRVSRYRRSEQDFESLRPYVVGDNYRHIDWKATARQGNLVSRQFQVAHHHQILVCLDTSRLMKTVTEGYTKLDWAIESTLQLAHLAKRYQDKLGVMVFSNRVHRWLRPSSDPVTGLLHALYDIEAQVVEADYHQACMAILAEQKKRSLVVMLSDFMDAASLKPYLGDFAMVSRKHAMLFVGIEDPALHQFLTPRRLDSVDDLMTLTVAEDLMTRRHAVLEDLRRLGLHALSTHPRDLVVRLQESYLAMKFSGVL